MGLHASTETCTNASWSYFKVHPGLGTLKSDQLIRQAHGSFVTCCSPSMSFPKLCTCLKSCSCFPVRWRAKGGRNRDTEGYVVLFWFCNHKCFYFFEFLDRYCSRMFQNPRPHTGVTPLPILKSIRALWGYTGLMYTEQHRLECFELADKFGFGGIIFIASSHC